MVLLSTQELWQKLGVIVHLVEQSEGGLGRTALVKLLYLLQEVRGVPLGYDFQLYTYGPFDSDVLNDIGLGECYGALNVKMVPYPSGYGYQVTKGPRADSLKEAIADWVKPYEHEIQWAAANFGRQRAAELELIATVVYVDRELSGQVDKEGLLDAVVERVHQVKPRFDGTRIRRACQEAQNKGLLTQGSTSPGN